MHLELAAPLLTHPPGRSAPPGPQPRVPLPPEPSTPRRPTRSVSLPNRVRTILVRKHRGMEFPFALLETPTFLSLLFGFLACLYCGLGDFLLADEALVRDFVAHLGRLGRCLKC